MKKICLVMMAVFSLNAMEEQRFNVYRNIPNEQNNEVLQRRYRNDNFIPEENRNVPQQMRARQVPDVRANLKRHIENACYFIWNMVLTYSIKPWICQTILYYSMAAISIIGNNLTENPVMAIVDIAFLASVASIVYHCIYKKFPIAKACIDNIVYTLYYTTKNYIIIPGIYRRIVGNVFGKK